MKTPLLNEFTSDFIARRSSQRKNINISSKIHPRWHCKINPGLFKRKYDHFRLKPTAHSDVQYKCTYKKKTSCGSFTSIARLLRSLCSQRHLLEHPVNCISVRFSAAARLTQGVALSYVKYTAVKKYLPPSRVALFSFTSSKQI